MMCLIKLWLWQFTLFALAPGFVNQQPLPDGELQVALNRELLLEGNARLEAWLNVELPRNFPDFQAFVFQFADEGPIKLLLIWRSSQERTMHEFPQCDSIVGSIRRLLLGPQYVDAPDYGALAGFYGQGTADSLTVARQLAKRITIEAPGCSSSLVDS